MADFDPNSKGVYLIESRFTCGHVIDETLEPVLRRMVSTGRGGRAGGGVGTAINWSFVSFFRQRKIHRNSQMTSNS